MITLRGAQQPLSWTYTKEKELQITLPADAPYTDGDPLDFAYVFEIHTAPE
jgi:hypothetical protein